MKKEIIFTGLLFLGLFLFLELTNRFHFLYIEQFQLFLFTTDYFNEIAFRPGGICEYCSKFLTQFFILPFAGALIVSFLLTGIYLLTACLLKKDGFPLYWFLVAFIPCFFLLFCHFDLNYFLQGTLAFFLCVLFLYILEKINTSLNKNISALFLMLFLYIIAGPVAIIFAFCYLIIECIRTKTYRLIIFPACIFFLSLATAYLAYRLMKPESLLTCFLPDFYYQPNVKPASVVYLSWFSLPLSLILSALFAKRKLAGRKVICLTYLVQVLMIISGLIWGLKEFGDRKSYLMKELDYYSETEQWDKIIQKMNKPHTRNYLFLNYLNLALAQKGELTGRFFDYNQYDASALTVNWNKTNIISTLLSDITFCVGDMASSRQYAYEAYVLSDNGNGRMLKRLIQTELVYGEYKVAEKYIKKLEQTLFYRQWAGKQRHFLNNDAACDNDPLIGYKRKCLPPENENNLVNNFYEELVHLVKVNPKNGQSVSYLSIFLLLNRDLNSFSDLINLLFTNNALSIMPRIYEEALLVLYEQHPEEWESMGITQKTVRLYENYKLLLKSNTQNPNLKNIMQTNFGNTYWFYLQFK